MPVSGLDLIVTRTALDQTSIVPASFPDPLPDGAVLLRIDSFALTANNITYGVAADMLGYWDFFPTGNPETGRIPVWGFAEVIASAHPQVPIGERVYGYLPMSTHLLVYPGRISAQGFTDTAPHRAERAPIYNHYALTRTDPLYQHESEALISLFRPLFTTSFLLEDLHRSNAYFGAQNIILSSASSKTSIGLAFLLSQTRPDGLTITGLTSPKNRAFVAALGCYDHVVDYADVATLPLRPSAFVDMAGNADLRAALHGHLTDNLTSSRAVGMTHWQASAGLSGDLPGPRPEFFFAPSYAQTRLSDWGQQGFQSRLADAWTGFIDSARGWFTIAEVHGAEAARARYLSMLAGELDPSQGLIVAERAALKQKSVNLNHSTLPEIIDFNALSDAACRRLNRFRSSRAIC